MPRHPHQLHLVVAERENPGVILLRMAWVWQAHGCHSGKSWGWQGHGVAQEVPAPTRKEPDPASEAPTVLEASTPVSLQTFGAQLFKRLRVAESLARPWECRDECATT